MSAYVALDPLRKEGWDVPPELEDGLQFYSRTAKVRVA
jgi:hypothetical protein